MEQVQSTQIDADELKKQIEMLKLHELQVNYVGNR